MRVGFDDVAVSYGPTPVLRGATGELPSGRITGILGPNGAGKSTLLRCLAGLQPMQAGRVLLGTEDLARLSPRERALRVASVPQTPQLEFKFGALDVVLMGRHPHLARFAIESEADHALAREALRRTETEHLADRDATTLSGGERQLVFIAKAIAQDTPVLLLDEPISALDVRHQLQVLDLMTRLAAQGRTVAAALHDVTLAARICDHLLVVADGGIHASGAPADVLTPGLMRDVFRVEADIDTDPRTGTVTVSAYQPSKEIR